MRLTGTRNGCMTCERKQTGPLYNLIRNEVAVIYPQVSLEEDSDLHRCSNERQLSSDRTRPLSSVEDTNCSASFHLHANEWLAFGFLLLTSSYTSLSKNVRFFHGCRMEPTKKVSLPGSTIPYAGAEDDATAVNSPFSYSDSESSGSSHRCSSKNSSTRLCNKCDSSSEILDYDRACYWDSLLSLEEEDSEWISDSKPYGCSYEHCSTPLSTKSDSSSEISDFDRACYWGSLLSLEEEDSEWISDSKPYGCSYENCSPPSTKCDSSSEISDFDRACYWGSLLSLEEEDSEWISDSKAYGCSYEHCSTPLSTKCDSSSEISYFDRACYWNSLLSLEEEDSEWISDSKPYGRSYENCSTPLSTKSDSSSEISDFDRACYWGSLLSLEGEDSELISDSKPYGCSYEHCSTPLSTKCDSSSEISYFDRACYWGSLISLEEEDSEWISDSKPYGCSHEHCSTPLSTKCDSSSDISDFDRACYWDSLLGLEEEDSEWISVSKPELENFRDVFPSLSDKDSWVTEVLPSVSSISSLAEVHCNRSEDNISAEHLLETADMEEVSTDEALFWPFEGKLNRNSEECWSSFCVSPRRRLVFGSGSTTSKIKECKQQGNEAVSDVKSEPSGWSKSSAKIVTLESNKDEKVAPKRGEMPSDNLFSLRNTFLNEDFASNKDLALGMEDFALDQELPIETLVGLKEFDGHEGLDSEFNGVAFMLDESL